MAAKTYAEIEDAVRNFQAEKQKLNKGPDKEEQRVGLGAEGHYDTDIYGEGRYEGVYVTSIAANDDAEDDDDVGVVYHKKSSYTAPLNLLHEAANDKDFDPMNEHRIPKITDREDDYRAKRRNMIISPVRYDPFADAMIKC